MNDCELDIGSGEVIYQSTDFYIPSMVPVELTRRYTSSVSAQGLLGWSWLENFGPCGSATDEAFTKINALDGDTPVPWDSCDGTQGPAVGFFGHGAAIPPKIQPLPKPAILKKLRERGKDEFLIFEQANGGRETYLPPLRGDGRWILAQVSDRYRNSVSYRYTGGLISSIRTSEGHEVRFGYGGGRVARVTVVNAGGATLAEIVYEYDSNGDLTVCRDAAEVVWRYEYVDHLLVRFHGPNGLTHNYVFDANRICVGSWYDGGERIRLLARDDVRKRVLITDSYGLRTLLSFNEFASLVEHTDARGQVSSNLVDGENQVLATIGADGVVQSTIRLDAEKNALLDSDGGAIWERQLDNQGRVVRNTSPTGLTEKLEYGPDGELHRLITWNGGVFEYGYDERGNVSCVTDPLGYEIRREELSNGRVVRIQDREGMLFEQTFDAMGNLLSEKDASGRESHFTYCAVGNQQTERGPSGEQSLYEYDDAQNMTAWTDALGRISRFDLDPRRQVTAEVDPMGGRVEYQYDLEGSLVRVINERKEPLDLTLDELYRETGERHFDGRTLRYALDPVGRRVGITDARGRLQTIEYADGLNPARRIFHDGAVEEYMRNAEGEYVGISLKPPAGSGEPERSASFEFDATNRMTRDECDGVFIMYEWDRAGHLIGVRDSAGGETRYELDGRYEVTKITEGGRDILLRHLPTGEMAEILYPNGLRHSFSYDGSGRMAERTTSASSGKVLSWRRYAYDSEDQLVTMEDSHWGSFRYAYDPCGRLTSVTSGDGKILESYTYDTTGNLIGSPLGGRAVYGRGNRIETAGPERFEFDADGNLIARRDGPHEWRYTWDRDDQLDGVWRDGVQVAAYQYDLTNRRRRKTTDGGTTEYLYETYTLRAEVLPGGAVRHYVSLPGLPVPIACWGDEGWLYLSYDQIGTPYEVFNEAGELLATFHPHAFGCERRIHSPSGSEVHLPFGFMGQYRDEESGLCYNHFRYYDPRLGRYISPDPLGIFAGMNFYVYPQNPNNDGDLCGLMPTFTCPPGWNACQKKYARAKINRLSNAPASHRKKTCTTCRKGAQRSNFKSKRCGKSKIPRGRVIDHMHELQAGGHDTCCANLRAVPKRYNRQLGEQTSKMLKGVGMDKVIGKISMPTCNGGKCSKAEMDKLATPPKDTSAACTEPRVPPPPC